MKRIISIVFIFLISAFAGYMIFSFQNPRFNELGLEEMLERLKKERDYAIKKAAIAGLYRCCINPPCTMCYMEANQWNNEKAGTCACDDLIAQGKEPCPQCKRGLCGVSGGSCNLNK